MHHVVESTFKVLFVPLYFAFCTFVLFVLSRLFVIFTELHTGSFDRKFAPLSGVTCLSLHSSGCPTTKSGGLVFRQAAQVQSRNFLACDASLLGMRLCFFPISDDKSLGSVRSLHALGQGPVHQELPCMIRNVIRGSLPLFSVGLLCASLTFNDSLMRASFSLVVSILFC